MNTLTQTDLQYVLSHVPKDVRTLLQQRSPVFFLAGGFIRAIIAGEKVSDVDVFGATAESLETAAMCMALARNGSLHRTKNAFTVLAPPRMPVQFITRWLYDDPQKLVESFDFTVARACIWFEGDNWKSCCDPLFYPDLAARRLTYCSPDRDEDAGGSLLRMRKFLGRGYTIQVKSLAGLVARTVKGIDVTHAERAAGGVDKMILGRLYEVDPLRVIDGMEIAEEHEHSPAEADR